jgi:DNA-directed RNA polymerase I, II, and III subunit RPABC2
MSSYFEDDNIEGIGNNSDNETNTNSSSSDAEEDENEENGDEEVGIENDVDEGDEEETNDGSINNDEDDQTGGALDDDLEEGEMDEAAEKEEQKKKRTKKIPAKEKAFKKIDYLALANNEDIDNNDDDDDEGELYLQKFEKSINENYIVNYHPESVLQNYDEILTMIKVIRDKDGIIIDDLHKTIPFLTKYEKARILGQRAKQINSGSTPFVKVPENVIDGYVIAELELKVKKIPFIIRRPLPNGGSEYWSIRDLEDISF